MIWDVWAKLDSGFEFVMTASEKEIDSIEEMFRSMRCGTCLIIF